MMKLEVYLKKRKKPIVIISRKSLIDNLFESLKENEIIKIGQIIFRREDFIYAVEEEK